MTSSRESDGPRVRFAPSPTGYLHIGGARTALFNYLFARQQEGVFVLRIEDTDRQRSTQEAIAAIHEGLEYLGLDWDEGPDNGAGARNAGKGGDYGPYFQSERGSRHEESVQRLVAAGKAYPCFCSRERLDALRESQRQAKSRVLYDRTCLSLSGDEVAQRLQRDDPHVIRFRIPDGKTEFEDLVRGSITFEHREIEDFILRRTDGSCVYNLAVACDDHDMQISHVIRGEDHLSNTPKQILLLQALGYAVPAYAHIPLILGPGGGKLSKRHGAVSVTEYRERGYLPAAMVNFLVRLGWSFDDKEEIFSMDDLVEKFSLAGVSKSGAVYDLKKLQHLGAHYLRQRPVDDIFDDAVRHIARAGLIAEDEIEPNRERLHAMVALAKDRVEAVGDIADQVGYYFEDPSELDAGALKALRKKKDSAGALEEYRAALETELAADAWSTSNAESLETHAREFVERAGVRMGDLAQPLRAILTGRSATPGLFEVMAILGRTTCLRRLARAEHWFAEASA